MNINSTEKKEIKLVCANCFHKNLWTGELQECPVTDQYYCWSCEQCFIEDIEDEVERGRLIEVEI